MRFILLKLFIIPALLIFGYLALATYPYFASKISYFDSLGMSSLVEEKYVNVEKISNSDQVTDKFDSHLFKGEKIISKFKATENNFGIVLFRFDKISNRVSDTVVFRIRKEGEKKWYYENAYKADQFQPNQYFTFGFPAIINSKNNTYEFEIESLAGTSRNGIGIGLKKPQVALVYKFNQNDLKDFDLLSSFVFKKTVYAVSNADFFANWQLLAALLLSYSAFFYIQKSKISVFDIFDHLLNFKKTKKKIIKIIIKKIKPYYSSLEKKLVKFLKITSREFKSSKFYLRFLNTDRKKKIAIGLLIFLLAFAYRFSASLVYQQNLFYAGLGGQGDYDQFIRAATCSIKTFCSWILTQNLFVESSILGFFYEIFGFMGGLKAYLYLMFTVSSIVALIPYILLSRKNWASFAGIIGSIFLATSDFLTQAALNFPPDNGSTFIFSMFFLIYFLTLRFGTIRWLLLFGFIGFFDGMFKALFLINDLVVLALFVPVFFFEKARLDKGIKITSLFQKKNIKILFLSLIPLSVFTILYSTWEYIVHIKFDSVYFLRGLIETNGTVFVTYTLFREGSSGENFMSGLLFLCVSVVVMMKRLVEYADLQMIYFLPIFLGLFVLTIIKSPFDKISARKFSVKKFIIIFIFSIFVVSLLVMIKDNYFKIHETFGGYLYTWTNETFTNTYLFMSIIFLFVLNFRYSALKRSIPIVPYVIMLIILTKNSPFPRISTQVVTWSIILLAFLIDWILINFKHHSIKKIKIISPFFIFVLFVILYLTPKMYVMITQFTSGFMENKKQIRYLEWVENELPSNAIVLAGGKSDLITLGENLKKPIVYSSLWTTALLIKPNEIPGVTPSDFSIVSELQNKNNFKIKKYTILEDDIFIWRARVTGVADGVFTADPKNNRALHGDNYTIKVYKSNPALNKNIYELKFKEK